MRPLPSTLCKLILAIAASTLLCQLPAQAQIGKAQIGKAQSTRAAARTTNSDQLVLRTYEVADLVTNVPDYPYTQANRAPLGGGLSPHSIARPSALGGMGGGMGGGMVGMGGGMGMGAPGLGGGGGMGMGGAGFGSSQNAPGSGNTIDGLFSVIKRMCSPSSWREAGGSGDLESLGHSLIVLQAPPVHQQIEDLLEQLRKGSGKRKTVTIDARWLLLTSDDLEKVAAADAQGIRQVDRKVLAEYTRRPSSIRGMTTCFSGQLVYLISGTRQNVVTGVIPVVGSIGKPQEYGAQFASQRQKAITVIPIQNAPFSKKCSVGYQPIVERPNFGVLLEIRPTLVPEAGEAIVDLRSTLTVPGKSTVTLETRQNQPLDAPTVDRIAIDTQELATTLSLPLGEPVLVGGLTYVVPTSLTLKPASDKTEQPTSQETPQLYLFLELRTGAGS